MKTGLFGGEVAKVFMIGEGKMNCEIVSGPVSYGVFVPVFFDALR
jgi:hypothetical protein